MKTLLSVKNPAYAAEVRRYVIGAFLADKGKGDITSQILIPISQKGQARIIAKQSGILAGIEELTYFLDSSKKYVPSLSLTLQQSDGDILKKKEVIGVLHGTAKDILLVERTILNLLQRMSGIATLVKAYRTKMKPAVKLAATRKTLWGLLDKKACTIGGALPHRLGLYDAVLIKDNHLTLLKKDFPKILEKLIKANPKTTFNEIEIASIGELKNFLAAFQKIPLQTQKKLNLRILLDNMAVAKLRQSVEIVKKASLKSKILLEASGGVNFDNIKKISQTGVDIISVGALTHSAPALDISLTIAKNP